MILAEPRVEDTRLSVLAEVSAFLFRWDIHLLAHQVFLGEVAVSVAAAEETSQVDTTEVHVATLVDGHHLRLPCAAVAHQIEVDYLGVAGWELCT